jgi:hypothetical protein
VQTPPETAQHRWKWAGTAAELQRSGLGRTQSIRDRGGEAADLGPIWAIALSQTNDTPRPHPRAPPDSELGCVARVNRLGAGRSQVQILSPRIRAYAGRSYVERGRTWCVAGHSVPFDQEVVMGFMVSRDDGWRMPDWLWEHVEPLLPAPPSHPLGCHNPRVANRDAMARS